MSFVRAFLQHLSDFNSVHALEVSRIAINYVELYLDNDFVLVDKLNEHFRFNDVFGKSQEIMFRLNNEQTFNQMKINVITTLQSGSMTNNLTFEDANGIVVHYDINNKPVKNIEFDKINTYFDKLNEILGSQQDKIGELLANG